MQKITEINKTKDSMNRKKLYVILLPLIAFLSGCAGMNSSFDCPMKPGVRCESLDQVSHAVDRGEIGDEANGTFHTALIRTNEMSFIGNQNSTKLLKGEPLRYGESVQRIWVAPFEDTSGNYHQESEVYTITQGGHWIVNPIKAMHTDEE